MVAQKQFQSHKLTKAVSMTALISLIALSSKQRSSQFARAFVPLAIQNHGYKAATATTTATRSFNFNPSTKQSLLLRQMSTEAVNLTDEQKAELESKIKAKGDEVRALKESGADKEAVGPVVAELLALKAELDPSSVKPKKKKNNNNNQKKQKNNNNQKKQKNNNNDDASDFIESRENDYSKWYNDIIRVTDLAETSPVRGCMVIKPWGMSIWDNIRNDLDARIKEHGAENAYFPLLIPKSFLSKEAEHVDGFAKECAVVTHHKLIADPDGEKGLIADPDAELEDPLIIRPTSETMIWNMFKKWIISHR